MLLRQKIGIILFLIGVFPTAFIVDMFFNGRISADETYLCTLGIICAFITGIGGVMIVGRMYNGYYR